jgi:hypothetical protein
MLKEGIKTRQHLLLVFIPSFSMYFFSVFLPSACTSCFYSFLQHVLLVFIPSFSMYFLFLFLPSACTSLNTEKKYMLKDGIKTRSKC